jgi:4-amino-4-deoxy-L-arabinose transferase-like glycosyltransferase
VYRSRALGLLLALGLALRLMYGLAQDPLAPYGRTGGDDPWYLANALALVTNAPPGTSIHGIPTDVRGLNQPPVFFLAAGTAQALLPPGPAVVALRIVHALATTAVALFGFGLAARLVGGLADASPRRARRAGLIAAGALALSPALILESAQVKTESLYLFFVTGGVWAYVEAVMRSRGPHPRPLAHEPQTPAPTRTQTSPPNPLSNLERGSMGWAWRWWLLAGALLGLATLTRAVFLLFPLALAAFTPVALGWRPGWKAALALMGIYAAVVLSWSVYTYARYERIVIAGAGLPSFLYIGATGWDDPAEVDQRLEEALGPADDGSRSAGDFLNAAGSAIGADVPGYIARRLGELGGALLQPHNVEVFAGASLRGMALQWWETDRSLGGLFGLTQGDSFWPKLLLYGFHVTAWIAGIAGMVLTRQHWLVAVPLLGFIAYTLLIHLFLLALPRYLFPVMPFVWVFAAAALSGWAMGKAKG